MGSLNFKPRFSFYVFITFILFTIIGTLLHELGHIAVAKTLGYETKLSYGFMNYYHPGYREDEKVTALFEIMEEFHSEIMNGESYIKEKEFEELQIAIEKQYPTNPSHSLYITLGGPIQTLLTACLGLLILWYRKSKSRTQFTFLDWLGVFLSLFVLREVFNFLSALYYKWFLNTSNFHADEFRISRYLGFNEWVIPILTAILGGIVSMYIIFKIIPKNSRFSFIVSGFFGGVFGFAIWFGFLGKQLLP